MNQSTAAEIYLLMQSMAPKMERLLRLYAEVNLGITWRIVFLMVIDIAAEEAKREIRALAAAPL